MPTNQFKDPKARITTRVRECAAVWNAVQDKLGGFPTQVKSPAGKCRRPLLHMKNHTSAAAYPPTAAAFCSAGWLGVFTPNSLTTSFGYHIQYLRKNWLSGEFLTSSTSIICSCDNSRLTNSGNLPEQPYLILFKLLLDCCQVERMSFP